VRERTLARIVIEEQETDSDGEVQRTIDGLATRVEATPARTLPQTSRAATKPIAWIKQSTMLSRIVAAALVVAIAVVGYLIASRRGPKPQQTPLSPNSLAILPFRNLRPNAETDFLGSAMADAVISKLGHIRTLMVRPSSYVQKYRNQEVDPQTVANELGVDRLLTGSFLKDGDDLRVTAQLIDVSRSDILWRDTIDLKYDKLLTMEDLVAQKIIKGLQLNLSPEETERLKLDAAQNPLAYEDFLRGRYLISSHEHQTAIKLLEESVTLDPSYALAWKGLQCYGVAVFWRTGFSRQGAGCL